jgi:adenylate cyclase
VAAVGWSGGAVFLSLVLTLLLFLLDGVWLDSVALIGAAVGATVLVSQLTYASERQEKQRQRNLLQRFAPPQIIDQLLDDPHSLSLGGSRSRVCVLFADVRNFTRFAERHSPEEVIEVTNIYLVALTAALHRFGGFLGTYTGDGLMGFFVSETEADVERAVHAALAMRDAAVGVSQRMQAEGREPLNIGIGVHYGEAVVGLVGSPERPDYTVIGHTVIVSHRLQSIALGGEVVLSEAAYDACGQTIDAEEGDPVQVKGLSAPVTPYRVSGIRALPAPEPVAAA